MRLLTHMNTGHSVKVRVNLSNKAAGWVVSYQVSLLPHDSRYFMRA